MQDFEDLISAGLLWAYCIELSYEDVESIKYIYTFRKLNSGSIIVDEKDNKQSVGRQKKNQLRQAVREVAHTILW